MKLYYTHGFNVTDAGRRTLDSLAAYLGEWDRTDVDYGWSGLIGVSLCNQKLAKAMAQMTNPQSVFVGHSNGCAIQAQAINYGASAYGVIWIAPALPSTWRPPKYVRFMHIYYDPNDIPVRIGSWLGRLNIWGESIPWGDMGYRGSSAPQATNIQVRGGHSGLFKSLDTWGPRVADRLRRELT